MSIFKETFPRYVRKQLEVREALIQQGNEEANRFQSTTTKSGVTISPGSYTLNLLAPAGFIPLSPIPALFPFIPPSNINLFAKFTPVGSLGKPPKGPPSPADSTSTPDRDWETEQVLVIMV